MASSALTIDFARCDYHPYPLAHTYFNRALACNHGVRRAGRSHQTRPALRSRANSYATLRKRTCHPTAKRKKTAAAGLCC
eukprot:4882601-Pleurochrysis_carterae.AAC.5